MAPISFRMISKKAKEIGEAKKDYATFCFYAGNFENKHHLDVSNEQKSLKTIKIYHQHRKTAFFLFLFVNFSENGVNLIFLILHPMPIT